MSPVYIISRVLSLSEAGHGSWGTKMLLQTVKVQQYEELYNTDLTHFSLEPLSHHMETMRFMFLFQLDSSLVHLESRLNETRMRKFVNVVILSDHGMTYGHHSSNHSVQITKINLMRHLNREHIRSVL